MGGEHEFATPAAPPESASQRLTNDDFRKIMMTPRAPGKSAESLLSGDATSTHFRAGLGMKSSSNKGDPNKALERKKKKQFYSKLKKDEEDKLAELAAKYRDRAKERRDGGETTQTNAEEDTANTAAYRAVAPNARDQHDAAERRRQMIQESKYLGGDMEHTHLVKGLDFALLQKVRSEISIREAEAETKTAAEIAADLEKKEEKKEEEEQQPVTEVVECRTTLAKSIMRTAFYTDIPKVNELFYPGRMAYVMDLDEEGESDIPTTSIRSKLDVTKHEQKATLSTNDIVINKLTQILSYLRAGNRNKKKKKEKLAALLEGGLKQDKGEDMPIYEDIGDYKPKDERRHRDDRGRDRDRRDDYHRDDRDYDRNRDRDRRGGGGDRDRRDRDRHRYDRDSRRDEDDRRQRKSYFDEPADKDREAEHKSGLSTDDKQMIRNLMKKQEEKDKNKPKEVGDLSVDPETGYAECYPGLMEMEDAIGDSDEETDFSKMDLGNKKGPVGRWDFDTAEEYSDYMSTREALPKAAFQYGMKMADGRKTRGKLGQKNEKAKLDKEWNQISALLEKRKSSGGGGGSSKKAKYTD